MNSSKQADGNRFNFRTLLICLITLGGLWWAGDLAAQHSNAASYFRKPEKIVYEDFLFASAIAEKDFQEKHPKLGVFYEYQQESPKTLLKKSEHLLVDKLNSFVQEGYPITRLRLVRYCLGKDVFDTRSEEKTVSAEDLSLSNDLGLALTNPESKANLDKDEIAKAFPDDCMRHFFWRTYYEKRNESNAAKKETELLRISIKPIQSHIVNVIITDSLTVFVGLIIFLVLLARKKLFLPGTNTSDNLIYPKPKGVLFSILSVVYVAVCGSMLCTTIDLVLRLYIATSTASAIRYYLIYPAQLIGIYFLAIKQQGLNIWQGIGLRSTTKDETKRLVLQGIAAFFVLSFLSSATIWISMILPSAIIEDSSLDMLVMSVNRSITIPLIIVVTITGPFVEEAIFRGYLYQILRTKIAQSTAMILTAALFSASHFHFNPYTAGHHFLMGLVTIYIFVRTRSLLPAIICHSVWNATVSISLLAGLCKYYSVQKVLF